MSLAKFFVCGVSVFALLAIAGCDNSTQEPDQNLPTDGVAATGMDSMPGSGFDSGVPGAFGAGADDGSVGGGVEGNSDLVAVSIKNTPTIYFAYDSDTLVPGEQAKLDKVADHLSRYAQLMLIVEGHCDQRGTEEYNRALGERRANAIRRYLSARGVSDGRIRTVSYGKDRPAVQGNSPESYGKNRRGELIFARKR